MSELHCSNDISSKGALRDLISKYFDLAEIQILSTTLGIDYDDIPGGARKSLKIEGLIDYMRRRGRLDDLLQQLQLERPKVEWPVTSMPSTEEEVVRLLDTYSSKHTQSKIEFGLRLPSEKHAHESWPVKVTEGWQLPKPADYFINRVDELQWLMDELRPGCVITLCGPEGIGKMALVAEALKTLASDQSLTDRFPDGVIHITLNRTHRAENVFEEIARSLEEDIGSDSKFAAKRALAKNKALLLLENTDQVSRTDLEEILDQLYGCGALLTSLRHTDVELKEKSRTISPLPLEEGVKLLKSCAGSRANDDIAAANICKLLGGLPLAIRLVGKHLMGGQQEAADYLVWLESAILTAQSQFADPVENIQLIIKKNLKLISKDSREVLAAAGMLAFYPFNEELMTAALNKNQPLVVVLAELVNLSFLQRGSEPDGSYEFTHFLLYLYAQRKLRKKVPSNAIERLATYFVDKYRDKSKSHIEKFNKERPHIISILQHLADERKWGLVIDLVTSVDDYLNRQGFWTDREIALEHGLKAATELEQQENKESFLGNLGNSQSNKGEFDKAIQYYNQALNIARKRGQNKTIVNHLNNLGISHQRMGKIVEAESCYNQALEIARTDGFHKLEGTLLNNLGNIHSNRGHWESASQCYEEALRISEQEEDLDGKVVRLRNLGGIYSLQGEWEKSIKCYKDALIIVQKTGSRVTEAEVLVDLFSIHERLQQSSEAEYFLRSAQTIFNEINDSRVEWLRKIVDKKI